MKEHGISPWQLIVILLEQLFRCMLYRVRFYLQDSGVFEINHN